MSVTITRFQDKFEEEGTVKNVHKTITEDHDNPYHILQPQKKKRKSFFSIAYLSIS